MKFIRKNIKIDNEFYSFKSKESEVTVDFIFIVLFFSIGCSFKFFKKIQSLFFICYNLK